MSVKNLRHVGIVVNNTEIAEKFYRNLLGLHFYARKIEVGDYIKNLLDVKRTLTWAKYKTDEGTSLLETWVSNEFNQGKTHIAFTVDNLDALFDKLVANGVFCYNIPIIDVEKKHKILFCEDLEKNLVELVEEMK